MNARSSVSKLTIEIRQIKETLLAIFAPLILQRTHGKIRYTAENIYQHGSVGFKEVLCDSIPFTYVCVNSNELNAKLQTEIDLFCSEVSSILNNTERVLHDSFSDSAKYEIVIPSAKIGLEFYQRQRRLLLPQDVPWEIWQMDLTVVRATDDGYLSSLADSLADELTSLHLNFISAINQSIYLPKVPSKSELLNVFDDSISDCNPYLYRIVRPQLSDGSRSSSYWQSAGGATVRRFLKDTLSF
ncbi:unnamed protein product [Dracunculus medinensis]|uniref:Autophagy-related protein 101 n=1 Tax=Dracunculus medinensis TaxID=318479 RepID=A0A158Q3R2_DRAME|nr:unnamed protein product [Dracunculus medinensis]